MSTPEFRLAPDKENHIKGIGLYARRPYHKSELIFTDKPLVRVPYKSSQPFMKQLWRHVSNDISSHPIVSAFKNMNRYDQKDFLRLHNSRKRLLTRADPCQPDIQVSRKISGPTCAFELLGIYLTNFFFLHEDLTGVFKNISRINHACAANAYLTWDRTNGEMRVVAASNIPSAGTEITIDYSEKFVKLGIFMILENIREHCRYFYGFWCQCEFCQASISKGSVQEISSEQEKNLISFHLDELEQKLLFKQEALCWEIRELQSRESHIGSRHTHSSGQVGMFATRRISKGEPIVGESPMFVLELHQDQLKGTTYIPSVMTAVQNLDQVERDVYLALAMRDPSVSGLSFDLHPAALEVNQLKEIFVSNAICLPSCCQKEGYCEWGVFQHLSRVNHSCMPNAVGMTYNRKLRGTGQCQHWLHARRDIECGEEITICYVEALCKEENVAVRASTLKDRFECWCLRCVHDRQGSSWVQNVPHTSVIDYMNENPSEYPNFWMERTNALPTTSSDQPAQQLRSRREKNQSIIPSLVFKDVLIELNKIPKKRKVLISARRTGRRMVNRISSLPSMVENAKHDISNVGKRKKRQEWRGDVLQRRLKFPVSSEFEGDSEHMTMRQALAHSPATQPRNAKGKQRANNGFLPTEWSTMSAIMVRQDSEAETNWGSGGTAQLSHKLKAAWDPNLPLRSIRAKPFAVREDNQTLGSNGYLNPTLTDNSDPSSTSTELWESSKARVETPPEKLKSLSSPRVRESPSSSLLSHRSMSNQSRGIIPFIHHGDHDLSDQYYMSRLGVEPVTAERLERANSLSLISPVDGEPTFEKLKAPEPLTMKSVNDGCTDSIQANSASSPKRNAVNPADNSIKNQEKPKETPIYRSNGTFDHKANHETLGSDRYPSLTSIECSAHNRKPSTGSRRMGRDLSTSATSSTDTVTRQPTSIANEGSVSSGELYPLSQEAAYPAILGRERSRGTSYRTSDGNFSTNRSDQDRRPSDGSEFEGPGRHVHPEPSAPRAASVGLLGVNHTAQYHPEHRRGPYSGSSSTYTHGVSERRATQSHERARYSGNTYGRPHQYERQPSTRSSSGGIGRDTRGRTQEYNKYSSNGQASRPGETGDNRKRSEYQRQKLRSESLPGIDRERFISDRKYRRPQAITESPRAVHTASGTLHQAMGKPQAHKAPSSGGEDLAQRTRELFDGARNNLPQPPIASRGPIEVGTSVRDKTGLCLDGTDRATEYPPMLGVVSSEGVYQVVNVAATKAPKRENAKSLPDGNPLHSQNSEEQAPGIGFVGDARSPRGENDQSESDLISPNQVYKEHLDQSSLDLPLKKSGGGRTPNYIKALSDGQTIQSSLKTGEPSDRPIQLLPENDNPSLSAASLAG